MNDHLERIKRFIQDRPTLEAANRDPERLLYLLTAEVKEFTDAVRGEPTENQHKEWLDIYWFVLSIAILWEIDIDGVFDAKFQRNSRKYRVEDFQEGSYAEAVAKIRREWTED